MRRDGAARYPSFVTSAWGCPLRCYGATVLQPYGPATPWWSRALQAAALKIGANTVALQPRKGDCSLTCWSTASRSPRATHQDVLAAVTIEHFGAAFNLLLRDCAPLGVHCDEQNSAHVPPVAGMFRQRRVNVPDRARLGVELFHKRLRAMRAASA